MNESDARVRRTRKAIREAIITMLLEMPYEEITVRGIAKQAGISYKTFYLHYQDQHELEMTILNQILRELSQAPIPPTTLDIAESNALRLLNLSQNMTRSILALTKSPLRFEFGRLANQFAGAEVLRFEIEGLQGETMRQQRLRQLIVTHFMRNIIDLVGWWLDNDQPFPPEEMAEYINHLLTRPIWYLPEAIPQMDEDEK